MTIQEIVVEMLNRAGAAHGIYEEHELGGVYDRDWPQWYAAHLLEQGLEQVLNRTISVTQLGAWLKACDEAYRQERPEISWPAYYAQRTELL